MPARANTSCYQPVILEVFTTTLSSEHFMARNMMIVIMTWYILSRNENESVHTTPKCAVPSRFPWVIGSMRGTASRWCVRIARAGMFVNCNANPPKPFYLLQYSRHRSGIKFFPWSKSWKYNTCLVSIRIFWPFSFITLLK